MTEHTFAPGHYPDMDNDAYHSGPGVSKSHLDSIAPPNSPAHYFERYLNPDREPEEKTPALILGDAIHKAVLEPDLLTQRYAFRPEGIDGRTKDGKAALADLAAANLGKTILSVNDYKTLIGVRDSAHRHPVAKGLFSGGVAEQSYFSIDPETGALIKCRIDYDRMARDGIFVDLKTTEDASPDGFGRSAAKYRYHVQGGWYPHVLTQLDREVDNFVFVAIEKSPPYAIGIYYLEPEDAQLGMMEARRDLDKILECRAAGEWPDHGYVPQALRIPAWRRREITNV